MADVLTQADIYSTIHTFLAPGPATINALVCHAWDANHKPNIFGIQYACANLTLLEWTRKYKSWESTFLWLIAAKNGQIDVLDYLRRDPKIDNDAVSVDVYIEAIRADNIKVLKWLYVYDKDWSDIHDPDLLGFVAIIAATHGKPEPLKWINGIKSLSTLDTADEICYKINEWAFRAKDKAGFDLSGYKKAIQFAHANSCEWSECQGCPYAVIGGHQIG